MINTFPNVHYPVVVAKRKTTTEQPEKENINQNTDLRLQSLLPILIILIIVLFFVARIENKD